LVYLAAALNALLFVTALGAIVGSFTNVLVYRLPRGLNVIVPASACPHCDTTLGWRDNIPILGWLALRGRCRYCKGPISPEYPLVETVMALLFGASFVLWFINPVATEWIGYTESARAAWAPEWTNQNGRSEFGHVWPVYVVMLTLIASLVAITLIDAKTFTIPLELVWVMSAVAVLGHVGSALFIEHAGPGGLTWSPHVWAIPVASGPWLGSALLGAVGVGLSALLLRIGAIPRSFDDYDEWERQTLAERQQPANRPTEDVADDARADTPPIAAPAPAAPNDNPTLGALLVRTILLTGPALAFMFLGFTLGQPMNLAIEGMAIGTAIGLVAGAVLRGLAVRGQTHDHAEDATPPADGEAPPPNSTTLWVQYPHARREMVKEALFCLPILALAALGFWLASLTGPLGDALATVRDAETGAILAAPPLWLRVLGGVCLGYLVGGGVVWAVRILGSLTFGKEAMGLGDVHLMAAVGACLGWIDPTIAFFVAPFFGILWAIGSVFLSRLFKREGMALPYGPHLAIATLVLVYAKPAAEAGLGLMWATTIDLP
jgi:prepilin signal peptidase PulO-like enzyme (type II secretory pathway)